MKRARELEAVFLRVEGGLVVVLVLAMLVLAGYNVLYRNVLVPLQTHWAHSGPPVTQDVAEPTTAVTKSVAKASDAEKEGGGAEGFGGAFGEPDPALEDEEDEEEEEEGDEGEDEGEDEDSGGDGGKEDAGGFGGAFGKPPPKELAESKDEVEDDLDAQFEDLPDIDTSNKDKSGEPEGGPPPEGSFAAWGVSAINKLRMDWIDVLLRQLVIIASFLGAGLATARKKHINIDALSKVLPPHMRRWVNVATNLLAITVCVVLAWAGKKLVTISMEFPVEVTPFADEWHFQLMFPIGFGLLGIHFLFRLLPEEPHKQAEPGAKETTRAEEQAEGDVQEQENEDEDEQEEEDDNEDERDEDKGDAEGEGDAEDKEEGKA